MPYETDFDAALTIVLAKAAGLLTQSGTPTTPVSTPSGTTVAVTSGIAYVIGDGGTAISNGNAGGIIVPFTGTITKVELQEFDGTSGSITVDILKGAPGNSPSFSTITGGSVPHITSGRHYSDSSLSGWTTSLSYGDGLRYTVSGAATIKRVTVVLFIRRTDILGLAQ